jgi:hypothetical protein
MIRPSTAKITDFETSFDAAPIASAEGEIVWADVRIDYRLSGLAPRVTIRVPVPWNADESAAQRKAAALRCARELIDHACRAAGVNQGEPETDGALEGIAQELGLAPPKTAPSRSRRLA